MSELKIIMTTINYIILAIIFFFIVLLLIVFIRRNYKDKKDLERELNQSEMKPEHHEDEIK